MVRSNTSVVNEQMVGQIGTLTADNTAMKTTIKENDEKIAELKEASEKLKNKLDKRTDDIHAMAKEMDELKAAKAKHDQLKVDFECVLQDKLLLEEKVHRQQKALKALQTVSHNVAFISDPDDSYDVQDRDLAHGERDQAIREKNLVIEEREQILSKSGDAQNMLSAVNKSKRLAMEEIKAHKLKIDEVSKKTCANISRTDFQLVFCFLATKNDRLPESGN